MYHNSDPKPVKKEKKKPVPLRRTELKRSKEYRIKPRSDKEAKRLQKYMKLRLEYLNDHPACEVKGCNNLATTIHHKKSRLADNLFKHFLACCMPCHCYIENNVIWARENGYSISRLTRD